jgi:hypothetical protein
LPEGLALLLEAYECSHDLQRDPWEFAVEVQDLRDAGVTSSTLRWLVCKGHVEHAVETTPPEAERRVFQRVGNLSLREGSCFVLTESGAAYARQQCPRDSGRGVTGPQPVQGTAGGDGEAVVPCWDAVRRELRLGSAVVKQYKQPAPDQEAILAAFEEEGWPWQIDDPLSPKPEQDAKQRLHSTINNLNRSQRRPGVHFAACNNGQGICWQAGLPTQRSGETRAKPGRI